MRRQLQIDITEQETRVALLEDSRLLELFIERSDQRLLVGNIYKGKVVRVLPGMQAAFVDIGQQRTGFLHVRDALPSTRSEGRSLAEGMPSIGELLREGQVIVVQVIKDPILDKGARLSTDISIAGRNLIYLPQATKLAISKKIDNKHEIERLSRLLESWVEDDQSDNMSGSYIVRTQAEGACEHQLNSDFQYLNQVWQNVQERLLSAIPGELLYTDLPLLLRTIRDHANTGVQSILINCPDAFSRAQKFAQEIAGDTADRITLYKEQQALFSVNDVESQIKAAVSPEVGLSSGGNLVIEQTEAMVTIDVNSGSSTGSGTNKGRRDLVYVTNLEASIEIARQIRLRNLAGMIIIDFIDMQNPKHKKEVLKSLHDELRRDPVHVEVGGMSQLGLVELTRKRTSQNWQQLLFEPCPSCAGSGKVKSADTVCYEIFREIENTAGSLTPAGFTVIAAPDVVAQLADSKAAYLGKLENALACQIKLVSEPHFMRSEFDLALA